MARLPQPGGDDGNWGEILNEYLSESLAADGKIKPGAVTKADVGLGNVDNTSDVSKPVSVAMQAALDQKVTTTALDTLTASQIQDSGSVTAIALSSSVKSYATDATGRNVNSFEISDRIISPRLAAFNRGLAYGAGDRNILLVGDSTGDGLTRFVRLLADRFAANFSQWTIIYDAWSDASKTYPAGSRVIVQNGTNGRTLFIRNGSVSGQVIAYARDNIVAIANGAGFNPDLIIFNYGHNSPQQSDAYRVLVTETVNRYRNRWPKAPVIICTQNPRNIDVWPSEFTPDESRQQANYEYAAAEGIIVADVNAAYHQYGNYATDLLLADGLHPNAAGSSLWADVVWDTIRPSNGGTTVFPGHHPSSNRIWVPASAFHAIDGAPSLVTAYGQLAWALDALTNESIAATIDIPSAWSYQNISVLVTSETNGVAGNQRVFLGHHMYVGTNTGIGGSVNLGTWTQSGGSTANAQYTAGRTAMDLLWDRIQLGASPISLKVTRDATATSDTFASDILFLGLMVERAF